MLRLTHSKSISEHELHNYSVDKSVVSKLLFLKKIQNWLSCHIQHVQTVKVLYIPCLLIQTRTLFHETVLVHHQLSYYDQFEVALDLVAHLNLFRRFDNFQLLIYNYYS